MKQISRKSFCIAFCLTLSVSALTGCGDNSSSAPAETGNGENASYPISIMMKSFYNDSITSESKVWKQVEEYTNTKLDVLFTPDANYKDKLSITLASNSLPSAIFVTNNLMKTPSIVNAINGGAFWEIGPYLNDYPNLKQINPIVLTNTSYNGKTYGLSTQRPVGRNAITYRKDWLNNVGLSEPKTIDDFYNMLKAFKEKDPDQNGQNDTYGMVVTKYAGPWDIMQTWFGAPNKWGIGEDGKLVAAHLTTEYMDALKFFKKLYDEELVNPDFAVYDSAKWNDPVVNGKAGVIVDVVGRSHQIQEAMQAANLSVEMDVLGSVSGPTGQHTLGLAGFGGIFLISKSAVKTEADLKKVLNFFDKTNDKEMQLLINNGIEGTHYKTEDGKLVTLLTPDVPQGPDINIKSFSQLLLQVPNVIDTAFKPSSALREKELKVQAENEKIAVANPGEPLISNTYSQKGAQLDQQVEDARIKFIVGKLDEAGYQAEMELWKKNGGNDYTNEMNAAYAESK